MIERWGGIVARRPWWVLAVGVVLTALAAGYGAGVFGALSDGGFDDPDTESARELVLEREAFGNKSIDVVAIYSDDELVATDPEFQAEVEQTLASIPKSEVTSVVSWYDARDPSMLSKDQHAIQVLISLEGDSQDDFSKSYDEVAPKLESDELTTDLAGPWANYHDVNELASEDLARAETISLPIVAVLSLIIFGSAVAAGMPVLVALVSVAGSMAVVRVISEFTEVSIFSMNIITLIGMGLAVDYALFVVSRFREELAHVPDDKDGVRRALTVTMATAGRTVLFSGLTVAGAMASLLVFPQAFLRSMGYGGIAAVMVAMIAALTLLPATLALLGRRIDAGRIFPRIWQSLNRRRAVDADQGAGWARIARAVMRRPLVYVAVIVVALLAVGSPFLGATWGSVDHRVLPADAPAHVATEKLASEFGAETSNASILLRGADQAEVAAYTQEAEAVDGITAVQPVDQSGDTVLLRAIWEGNSQTEQSQQTVRDLRAIDAPPGAEVLVGGLSADTVDLLASVADHLPIMGVIVIVVMLVLLFVAFGSVVLPIKAILMNALSITASFGVVTWIFADGHFEDLLGFTSTGYLDATNPILMLAILFGLSMDYEVFLLSRVREEWDRTGDNEAAVVAGVRKTGRIITSAALLLIVVIGAFGLSGIVFMKMIGIGMALAILIDATIIRAILVPATMKLLGNWNWWAPGPLRRWWERYGFREEPAAEGPVRDTSLAGTP
ncbi:MMPL family transporter [Nocardioides speluncae]|uniref:MMPL family transporter n=1 Tax=Nocardioides speluncae TaxID=2670337 RepID=UPI000D6870E9|nr:MMPL family transporter [Nocardioides speluncae]